MRHKFNLCKNIKTRWIKAAIILERKSSESRVSRSKDLRLTKCPSKPIRWLCRLSDTQPSVHWFWLVCNYLLHFLKQVFTIHTKNNVNLLLKDIWRNWSTFRMSADFIKCFGCTKHFFTHIGRYSFLTKLIIN